MSPDEAQDWGCCFRCKFRCPSLRNLAFRWYGMAAQMGSFTRHRHLGSRILPGSLPCRECARRGLLTWTLIKDPIVGHCCLVCPSSADLALRWSDLAVRALGAA